MMVQLINVFMFYMNWIWKLEKHGMKKMNKKKINMIHIEN